MIIGTLQSGWQGYDSSLDRQAGEEHRPMVHDPHDLPLAELKEARQQLVLSGYVVVVPT